MSTDYSLSYIFYIFIEIEDKLIEIITDQMNFVLPYFFITRGWAHKMKHNFEFNAKNRNNSELLDWPNWPPYVDHGLKATVVQVYCLTIWSIANYRTVILHPIIPNARTVKQRTPIS